MTTGELAERATSLGVPIGASTVTKAEKLSRRITVDELAAYAEALAVPPAAMLLDESAEPVAEVAAFAAGMLRGPFRLEIAADGDGEVGWVLEGTTPPPRRAAGMG